MDYQEAKRFLHPDTTRDAIWKIADKQDAIKKINEACVIACDGIDELQEYKQLGTLEEVREAVEKQMAKKPNNVGTDGYRYTDTYRCPTCGGNFSGTGIANYCYHCGQAIDWGEEE